MILYFLIIYFGAFVFFLLYILDAEKV